jgi:hypothetical protein
MPLKAAGIKPSNLGSWTDFLARVVLLLELFMVYLDGYDGRHCGNKYH